MYSTNNIILVYRNCVYYFDLLSIIACVDATPPKAWMASQKGTYCIQRNNVLYIIFVYTGLYIMFIS